MLTFTGQSCPDPGTPFKGSKRGTFYVGQTIQYFCDKCYQLKGSSTIKCQPGLTWSSRKPTCEGKVFIGFTSLAPYDFAVTN